MKVNIIRKCETAVIPAYAHDTDAGLDLTATSISYDEYGCVVYGTGIAVEIPEGYVGLLFPRSSVFKTSLDMCNCVGVIDSGYRGEIMLHFFSHDNILFIRSIWMRLRMLFRDTRKSLPENTSFDRMFLSSERHYKVGDRVGQLIIMPYPKVQFVEVDNLSGSDRGEKGHGSTGK